MCGIAAVCDLQGRGRAQPWAGPLMSHRGPDGDGCARFARPEAVLEHRRLAIIDPENPAADQPMSDQTGRWAITYNGEVFNYRELRAELEREGVEFRTDSDTEVVLQAFVCWGEASVKRLRGMFAFVLVDTERGELFAARDQVGVKPLYWSVQDGLFSAASEMRTMLGAPWQRPTLDPQAVIEHLAFGYVIGGQTLVEGVRSLPPGHLLRVRDGRVSLEEYWDAIGEGPRDVGRDLEGELLGEMEEAIGAALVADVPISMMLSGGIDSSLIAAVAARRLDPAALTAYSISFGLPDDESATAARLAADLGIRHREILLDEDWVRANFSAWLADLDVPTANPTWIAVSRIAAAVHEDGGKVLLSGDGADELFGGYNRWMTYLRFHARYWERIPGPLRRAGGALARPFARGLAGDMARRARDGGDLFVGSRPFHDDTLRKCLGARGIAVAREHPPERGVEALRGRFDARSADPDYLHWMAYASTKGHLVEDYLARLDKMGMAHSVEGRVPFLDPHLVHWAQRVPQELVIDGYRQKALMRAAAARVLPDYILNRPKQGFSAPVGRWAQAAMAAEDLRGSPLVEEGLVRADAMERLRSSSRATDEFAVWTLGTLAAWTRANL